MSMPVTTTAPAARPTSASGGASRSSAGASPFASMLDDALSADRPAGRELVLKLEEASWLPSAFRDLETFLHGHLPSIGASTGLVLILTDPAARDARAFKIRHEARGFGEQVQRLLRRCQLIGAGLGLTEPFLVPGLRFLGFGGFLAQPEDFKRDPLEVAYRHALPGHGRRKGRGRD